MPSLVQVAGCYHTRFIDTAAKARFTGAIHFNFHPENAREEARKIVRMAVDAFLERDPKRVEIPGEPVSIMTGFSNEAILEALGGSLDPLLDAVKAGTVRGFVGVVGCNNPKIKHDSANVGLMTCLPCFSRTASERATKGRYMKKPSPRFIICKMEPLMLPVAT